MFTSEVAIALLALVAAGVWFIVFHAVKLSELWSDIKHADRAAATAIDSGTDAVLRLERMVRACELHLECLNSDLSSYLDAQAIPMAIEPAAPSAPPPPATRSRGRPRKPKQGAIDFAATMPANDTPQPPDAGEKVTA